MKDIFDALHQIWQALRPVVEPASLVVELIVIFLGLREWRHRKRLETELARKLGDSNGVLERYAGAVQMAKAHPAVTAEQPLIEQLNDLGGY